MFACFIKLYPIVEVLGYDSVEFLAHVAIFGGDVVQVSKDLCGQINE